MRIKEMVFAPVMGSLMKERWESWVLVGAGMLQVGLHLAGLPGWVCPIKAATGIPCPGCGLTAATGALLHGRWREALSIHAFAPLFLLAFVLLAVVSVLPEGARQGILARISSFEKRTGITAWVLFSLIIYWSLRLPALLQV